MTTLNMTKVPSRAPSGTASWLQRGWRVCLMLVLLVASLGVTQMAVAQADPDSRDVASVGAESGWSRPTWC